MSNTEHMLSLPHGWAESDILLLLSSHFLLSRLHHIDANKDFSETSRICAKCVKFLRAIFPYASLLCVTLPDKCSLDEKNWTQHLGFRTKPWQLLQRITVFQCKAWKMEGTRTMMPELGLRRRGKNSRGAAAAKRRKRASLQERLTLVASPKP